jgi:hypothetical protein
MPFSPGRNERGKQSLLTELKDLPSTENLDIFVADVSDPESVEVLGAAVKAKYGAVDHVVTSVGGWWQRVGHSLCGLLVLLLCWCLRFMHLSFHFDVTLIDWAKAKNEAVDLCRELVAKITLGAPFPLPPLVSWQFLLHARPKCGLRKDVMTTIESWWQN